MDRSGRPGEQVTAVDSSLFWSCSRRPAAYVESLRALPGMVAICDEQVVGFVALFEHDRRSSELHLFYLAAGFAPLFETLALWGPENSAPIMVKALEHGTA